MTFTKASLLAGLVAVLAVAPSAQSTWSKNAWSTILTRYATGDYAGAIQAIEGIDAFAFQITLTPDTPDNALTNWERAAPAWSRLGTSPAIVRRRQLIAATVALEIVRAHREIRPQRRLSLLTWACRVVRGHAEGSDAERLWYLASGAVMQESAPLGLLPTKSSDFTVRLATTPDDRAELIAGHLTHAFAAFPTEARLRLAEVLARAGTTSVVAFYPSPNWMHANELPVRKPPTDLERARELADRLAQLPAIERDLQALANEELVRAEAELNLAYLAARQQRWDDALQHLDRVTPFTQDALFVCISHYLRGWVYQRTERRDAAIAEYRTALESSPLARSISVMLADQLAQAGQQTEAYDVLDAALKAQAARGTALAPTPRVGPRVALNDRTSDPWEQFQHGDARLIQTYLSQLREVLR